MLSSVIFAPLLVAVLLAVVPQVSAVAAEKISLIASGLVVVAVGLMWAGYDPRQPGLAYETQVPWIPRIGTSYHVGLDGISLPLLALTALLFFVCAIYTLGNGDRPQTRAALFLFLESVSLGLFAAQDLILFFVFFDLSIVGMYFAIARWGHGDRERSALKFFLYTFLGSLALLLGFIGLYVVAEPHTFDMVALTGNPVLGGHPVVGGLILATILLGLAIKTPTFPFHTWLPPAHTDAPAIGSAILAGILLKMGTYGFVRIAMPMLPHAWRDWAWAIVIVGLISVIYGALVALAQTDLKRMIAYTSVNHMGYVVLGVGAAGLASGSDTVARQAAVTGAVTQMVAHGLTGALFLLAGVLQDRTDSYDLGRYGGLGKSAPRFAALFSLAAFASLGLPGFAGFIAEFHIFTGSIALAPVTGIALLGILITAALFLRALQRLFGGLTRELSTGFVDLRTGETVAVGLLMALAVAVGVTPQPLLAVIEPVTRTITALVMR